MKLFNRPITVGKILTIVTPLYFIGAFFIYLYVHGWYKLWTAQNLGVFEYSAATGLMAILFSIVFGTALLLFKMEHKFLVKLWNYPIIK